MKRLAPTDGLDDAEFLARNPPSHSEIKVPYRCGGCGKKAELQIPTGPVVCERCGTRMRPVL